MKRLALAFTLALVAPALAEAQVTCSVEPKPSTRQSLYQQPGGAYNVFYEYSFEVWQEPFIGSDFKIGSGTARDFQGIEFRLTKAC